jgi:uncharacterized repeat protein (TIGR02543 family)
MYGDTFMLAMISDTKIFKRWKYGEGYDTYTKQGSNSGKTYTVTFDASGESGTPPSPIRVAAGGSITLPDGSGLSKSYYAFNGWYDREDYKSYAPGDSFTPTGNVTLYANWTPTVKPGKVTGINAYIQGDQVYISWDEVPAGEWYTLYFNNNSEDYSHTNGTTYQRTIGTNTTLSIVIIASNSLGDGPASDAVTVHTD